ncbi:MULTISPECIES: DUF624 domain-containing protein [Gracilibacillus]|uniref:DUF624 domain-containing protein n=1 Tax=Gracilibacillus TaxID=74385 RepID=UPI000A539503|nr:MULTISPECIES: DUF624 domain-containing protein [Gracilibacillus]
MINLDQPESPLFRVLQIIAAFLALQLLWLFFSLGVVTVIPATLALYTVALDWSKHGINLRIWKSFYYAFVSYFKRTIYVTLFILSILTVFGLKLIVLPPFLNNESILFQASEIFIGIVFSMVLLAMLPLLVSTHLKGRLLWKNAWVISLAALPDLLLIASFALVLSLVIFYLPGALMVVLCPFVFIHVSLWKKAVNKLPQDFLDRCLLKYHYR